MLSVRLIVDRAILFGKLRKMAFLGRVSREVPETRERLFSEDTNMFRRLLCWLPVLGVVAGVASASAEVVVVPAGHGVLEDIETCGGNGRDVG
jgi:hypothetical protein